MHVSKSYTIVSSHCIYIKSIYVALVFLCCVAGSYGDPELDVGLVIIANNAGSFLAYTH